MYAQCFAIWSSLRIHEMVFRIIRIECNSNLLTIMVLSIKQKPAEYVVKIIHILRTLTTKLNQHIPNMLLRISVPTAVVSDPLHPLPVRRILFYSCLLELETRVQSSL
jgi:hypothetical protein